GLPKRENAPAAAAITTPPTAAARRGARRAGQTRHSTDGMASGAISWRSSFSSSSGDRPGIWGMVFLGAQASRLHVGDREHAGGTPALPGIPTKERGRGCRLSWV